jgi:hypothetical protein
MPIATDSGYIPDWLKALIGQTGSIDPGGMPPPAGLFSEPAASPAPAVGLLSNSPTTPPPTFTQIQPTSPIVGGTPEGQGQAIWGNIGPSGAAPTFTGVRPDAPMFGVGNAPDNPPPQADPRTVGDPQDINAPPPGRPNANVIGTEASGAPEVTAQKSLGLGDYLGKAGNLIGGLYGAGGPGDALIAMGLSNRTGGASIQALNAGIINRSRQAELALKQAEANDKIRAIAGNVSLVRKYYPNLGDEEASAFARNPEMMKQIGQVAAPMEQWTPLYKDADGNWLKRNLRTGDTQLVSKADPAWKDLTEPAERLAAGIRPSDTGVYQRNETTSQLRNVNEHGVSLNTAVNPVLATAGDVIKQGHTEARSAAGTLMALSNARQELDKPGGIISGFGANQRLNWAKLGALFGLDPKKIQNTESFVAEMKPMVLETVKGLGAGVGISNADREFALKAVGGDQTLDEGTLRELLRITEQAARFKVERHNQTWENFIKATPQGAEAAPYGSVLHVPMPDVYQTPQRPQAGGQKPGGQKPFTWSETE